MKKKLSKEAEELYLRLEEIRTKADKGLAETIAEAFLLGYLYCLEVNEKK